MTSQKPLSMVFEQSWESREVPADWKLANIVPVFKTGTKEDSIDYRPVSLTSESGKIMEKIILGGIEKCLKDNIVIGHSQQGFMRGKSCLSNLISLYDKWPFKSFCTSTKPANFGMAVEFSPEVTRAIKYGQPEGGKAKTRKVELKAESPQHFGRPALTTILILPRPWQSAGILLGADGLQCNALPDWQGYRFCQDADLVAQVWPSGVFSALDPPDPQESIPHSEYSGQPFDDTWINCLVRKAEDIYLHL
ncbi:hypothetical protein BTVI_157619 [Pitangus sulphuratus]|nr:hypothetical protein BTVI_157619 [Pitangus sulphuratus]